MSSNKKYKIGGIILLIVGLILLIGGLWAGITYLDGIGKQEDNKEYRETLPPGAERDRVDKIIEENEEMLKIKEPATAICNPIGIIMVIFGIVLILKDRKQEKIVNYNYSNNTVQQQTQQYNQQNQQELKFCTNCGAKIPTDSEFCTECGKKIK